MLSQTTAAEMELVDPALHHRSFAAAKVTTATNPLGGASGILPRLLGGSRELEHTSFGIDACRNHERTQRELAGSNLQHIRITMSA